MTSKLKKLKDLERKLTVSIPVEDYNSKFQTKLNNIKGKAKLDGFRKGKVPNDVLEQRYGQSIHADVVNDLIQSSYPQALSENKIRPASAPTVNIESEDPKKPITYSATFEVFPEIKAKLSRWTSYEKVSISITDSDIDLANFLSIESLQNFLTTEPFDEKIYAKLWLKEMSTSMDHDWQDIILELHPNENQLIPNIRVTLGGVRKTMQPASEYGFSNIENSSPNILLITLLLFSRKKKIRFFGLDYEKESIQKRIDQLNKHFELLFGKRKQKPIEYDDEQECWESIIKIVDRSSTARNDIRQSLDIFGKIINSYVGYDAV